MVSWQGGADPTMSSPPLLLWQAVLHVEVYVGFIAVL